MIVDDLIDLMVSCPITFVLLLLLAFICYFLNDRWVDVERVSFAYDRVLGQKEFWRAISSAMSHYSLVHFLFNAISLHQMRFLEPALGSFRRETAFLSYFELTYMVLIVSTFIHLVLIWLLRRISHIGDHLVHAQCVGYSGILFGIMAAHTFGATKQVPDRMTVFGQVTIPFWASPLLSLVIVHIIVPRASFTGHVSGILAGYLLAIPVTIPLFVSWTIIVFASVVMLLSYLRPRSGRSEDGSSSLSSAPFLGGSVPSDDSSININVLVGGSGARLSTSGGPSAPPVKHASLVV